MPSLTKTNFLLWRECKKNAWLKIHRPDIYFEHELSDFEKAIIETGNEVDELAREIFPKGKFQQRFEQEGYLAITDIITEDKLGTHVFEVKATNEIDKKTHYHDLAFQVNVLKLSGIKVASANLVHLNPKYVRADDLNLKELFVIENVTDKIREMLDEVRDEMDLAKRFLDSAEEPKGPCDCIYKGRSNHCTTFSYSNPEVPDYSVHDLARIGLSKRKLVELIDSGIYNPLDIPEELELTDIQKNQIWTLKHDREILSREAIAEELEKLVFPLYFLDYETFPAAVPRFNGFSPYAQIPFQYSLHVLNSPEEEPIHFDFLHTDADDPSEHFARSLMSHVGEKGSAIVWHKNFECTRNDELGKRVPSAGKFLKNLNERIYDLEDIFKKQHYVHKDFKGSSSIKKVLPVVVPALTYADLEIRDGGAAAENWDKIISKSESVEEKEMLASALRKYCKMDTYAMYAVWKKLYELVN